MESIQPNRQTSLAKNTQTSTALPSAQSVAEFNEALNASQVGSIFPIINDRREANDVLIQNSNRQESYWVPNGAATNAATEAALGKSLTPSTLPTEPCPDLPALPKGVDINQNITDAKAHYGDAFWFYDQVKNKGPWDYKQQGGQYETLGNFNFGATGRAVGFPETVLLRGAGWAQQQAGTSKPEYGNWYDWSSSYGDDPNDQQSIKDGINYYDRECSK